MRLNDDQLHNLIQLLTPRFRSVQERRTVLSKVYNGGSGLQELPNLDQTPENFTTMLVNALAASEGEATLAKLLTSLRESGDKPFARSLQPYINVLSQPGNGAPPPVIPMTRMDLSAGVDQRQSSKEHKHRRHKRGPVRRALHQVRRA